MGALALLVATAAAPGHAAAANRYVDFDTGNDQSGTNVCLNQATPCRSIANALLASGANPDTILVDDDVYPESGLTLGDGKSLESSGFEVSDSGTAIIDPGNSPSAVLTTALGAAVKVRGFTFRNDSARLVEVNGPATIMGNTFDETEIGAPNPHLLINAIAGDPTISGNVFAKSSQSGTAIRTLSADSPLITGNTISRYNGSIDIRAGTPQVVGNTITEQTGAGACDPCAGVYILNAQPVLTANVISAPVTDNGTAIAASEFGGGVATGVTLSRNVVRGGSVSVGIAEFGGGLGPVSLSSDLLVDYTSKGIDAEGDLTATNVTVASISPTVVTDIELSNNADLTLDSSIVFNTGISATLPFCAIAFSRGPTTTGSACQSFQTAANPLFRNAAAGDYRLIGNSLLIDAGNPAAPATGALDVAGTPRALARPLFGCPPPAPGPARRDMGAYEFVLDGPVPVPPCNPSGEPPQKCKKGKKPKKKAKRRCGKKKKKPKKS